jgi:hypothetical protein
VTCRVPARHSPRSASCTRARQGAGFAVQAGRRRAPSGHTDKVKGILQQVVAQYPGTSAAQLAQRDLKSLKWLFSACRKARASRGFFVRIPPPGVVSARLMSRCRSPSNVALPRSYSTQRRRTACLAVTPVAICKHIANHRDFLLVAGGNATAGCRLCSCA